MCSKNEKNYLFWTLKKLYMKKFTLSILLIFLLQLTVDAQRFKGGLVAGVNLSELVGEGIGHYLGLNAGVRGTVVFNEHWQLGTELLFSQKGEYLLPDYYPPLEIYKRVSLNYIEVPLQAEYSFRMHDEAAVLWTLSAGLAYVRLINHVVEVEGLGDITDDIVFSNRNTVLILGGLTGYINQHVGLNLRAALSTDSEILNWTLAARVIYMF